MKDSLEKTVTGNLEAQKSDSLRWWPFEFSQTSNYVLTGFMTAIIVGLKN